MYLLVLLGLLGTFEMNFYGGTKTQFEKGTGTEMCPSIFVWFSSPTFCPIFYPIPCPIVSSKFLFDLFRSFVRFFFSNLLLLLYVWSFVRFLVRFSGPISCSIFCPIFSTNFCLIFCPISSRIFCPIFCPIFLSDFLSDLFARFEFFGARKRRERVWTEGLNG